MFKLFSGLQQFLKQQEVIIDCAIFRLHSTFTTVLLLICSIIITATQYVGSPIQCIVTGMPVNVINTFCWITTTFTMPDAFNRQIGSEVPHPGIANDFDDKHAQRYYTYYQWVCFALFFQAIACYAPRYLWERFESGLMKTLVMGLQIGICTEKVKNTKKGLIIDYLLLHMKHHNWYAIRYWFSECLCLLNILGQLYLMDKFFGGEFFSYGLRVMKYSDVPQEDRVDPMVYVFPRVTKCIFHKYGPSGSLEKRDSLCILPLNIVNEKTYIFIWFWYMILATLLTLLLAYRIIIILVPRIRPKILQARNYGISIQECQHISRNVNVCDWWILVMLGTNIDTLIYKEIILELSKRIEVKSRNKR